MSARDSVRTHYDALSEWVGTVNWKTAPCGWFALAHSRPPCASMIKRQIESPSPKPSGLVVWKAWKMC
jgi:hypothetical protein